MRGRLLALTPSRSSDPHRSVARHGVVADAWGAEWSQAYGSIVTIAVVFWAALSLRRTPAPSEVVVVDAQAAATVPAHE